MSGVFLTKDEVAILTGRRTKSKQIEQLRKMGLPFWVNALGLPVVARSTIEGRTTSRPVEREKVVPYAFRDTNCKK